jgi:hypothetical protein
MLVAARLQHIAGTRWGTKRYLDIERLGELVKMAEPSRTPANTCWTGIFNGRMSVNCRIFEARSVVEQQPQDNALLGMTADVSAAGISVSAADAVHQPKSLLAAAASFAGSMTKFAASGFKRVDENCHGVRVGQCEPCEYRQKTQCTLCRCFIDKKAWLPHEDCPIGRWPA